MKTVDLHTSGTFSGEWFSPESNKSQIKEVAGTLEWNDRKARLNLHHSLDDRDIFSRIKSQDKNNYPVIHGVTTESKLITILNPLLVRQSFNVAEGGFRDKQDFSAHQIIIGAHVDRETKYTEIIAEVPGLAKWLGTSKNDASPYVANNLSGLQCIFASKDKDEIHLKNANLKISFSVIPRLVGEIETSITIKTKTYVKLKYDTPQSLEALIGDLRKTTTLLSLLAASPMGPTDLQLKKNHDDHHTLCFLASLVEPDCCTFDHASKYFILRNNLTTNLDELLNKWFDSFDSINTTVKLAMSVMLSKQQMPHIKFLGIMQALEGFHRATESGKYTTDEKYQEISNKILNAIPSDMNPDHRASLKARIRYGNEISLRKRLAELQNSFTLDIRKLIFGGDGTIPGKWVDTRNYFTHWDQNSRANILDGLDLHYAIIRLQVFLRLLLLQYAGVPDTALHNALLRNSEEAQQIQHTNKLAIQEEPKQTD